jgi:spore germination protein YaaH
MNKLTKRLIEEASGKVKRAIPQPENKFREGVMARHVLDSEMLTELMIEECVNSLRLNGYDDAAQMIENHFKEEEK